MAFFTKSGKGQPKDINDECYTQTPTKIKPMVPKKNYS